jgi:hypothetical protein
VVVTPASDNPLNIGQSAWLTANEWASGWSIHDIRKKSGLNPSNGFWIEMYADWGANGVGEAGLAWTKIPITAPQNIPVPTT